MYGGGRGEGKQKKRPRDVQLLLAKTKKELRSINNQLDETRKRAEENGMLESSAALQAWPGWWSTRLRRRPS